MFQLEDLLFVQLKVQFEVQLSKQLGEQLPLQLKFLGHGIQGTMLVLPDVQLQSDNNDIVKPPRISSDSST